MAVAPRDSLDCKDCCTNTDVLTYLLLAVLLPLLLLLLLLLPSAVNCYILKQ